MIHEGEKRPPRSNRWPPGSVNVALKTMAGEVQDDNTNTSTPMTEDLDS
jgi:hypothetical protein